MAKRKTPKAADKVEIKIDDNAYVIDTPVRDLLAMSTQVRDILANALVEWNDSYFTVSEKKDFHWSELKLKELVDKLLASEEQRNELDEKRKMSNSEDSNE